MHFNFVCSCCCCRFPRRNGALRKLHWKGQGVRRLRRGSGRGVRRNEGRESGKSEEKIDYRGWINLEVARAVGIASHSKMSSGMTSEKALWAESGLDMAKRPFVVI